MVKVKKYGKIITVVSGYTPEEIEKVLKVINEKGIIKEDENGNALFYYSTGKTGTGVLTKDAIVFDTKTDDGYAAIQVVSEKSLEEFLNDNMSALFHINSIEEFVATSLDNASKAYNALKLNAEEIALNREESCDDCECEDEDCGNRPSEGGQENA